MDRCRDSLLISVYDELAPGESADGEKRSNADPDDSRVERDRRFLGSIEIPFASVYRQRVLGATLQLTPAPVIAGYVSRRAPAGRGRGAAG